MGLTPQGAILVAQDVCSFKLGFKSLIKNYCSLESSLELKKQIQSDLDIVDNLGGTLLYTISSLSTKFTALMK